MSDTDLDLLKRYTLGHAEEAFTEIVRRHVNLVHSAALRQVRSSQLAEEVAQSVFTDLARNAERLAPDTILTAWLYQVTRRTAIDVVRREARRQLREQIATEMNVMNSATADWTHIEPLLDEAVSALDDTDRAAVLLRFFENKSLREVGQQLGVSDDAAQKRVTRAVERLREFFAKRGVTVDAGGLVVVISANAVQAAPVGLAATISATALLTGTAVSTSTIIAATKTIAMTTLQKTVITATIAVLAGTGIYEVRQAAQLREQNQTLQQQQVPLAEQIQQLQRERDDATNRLASMAEDISNNKNNHLELMKLRGEVTRLQKKDYAASQLETDDRQALIKSWLAREDKLKQVVEAYPDKKIPDLQLLSEEDWLNDAKDAKFDTAKDIQRTLAYLRNAAGNKFAQLASDAVSKYMKANNDQFPTELAQLQPYFTTPISEDILNRWGIMPQSAFPNQKVGGDWVIAVKDPVDRELDSSIVIGPGSHGSSDYQSVDRQKAFAILEPALKAYAADHNGTQAGSPTQIQPYLTTPEQQAALQTLIQRQSKKD